ncbi:MAG TPA: ATP-binding cassette domain-containing protein, partial [Clostridia bacterium]|nr:ATP-binding cassette domain-containing protein [Clostridia bacterium]
MTIYGDPILEVRQLTKAFGKNKVLTGVDFEVHEGDVISIIGASGSGKSTLLRCINQLERSDGGQIIYRGHEVRG